MNSNKSEEKMHKPFKKWAAKIRFFLHIVKGLKKSIEMFEFKAILTGYLIGGYF